ncbi:MAG: VWA domain-containing protein, partial [Thermomicrobiales bacterium]
LSGAFDGLTGNTSPFHAIVIVDGSTSMLARSEDSQRSRWEAARQEALAIVDDWRPGDVTTVVLMGTDVETRSASNSEQKDALRDWLRESRIPGGQADLNATLQLVRHLGLSDRENAISLITDTIIQIDPDVATTVGMPIRIVDVSDGNVLSNQAITAISAATIPGTDNQFVVSATISNFSDVDADVPWFVEADGVEIATNTAFLRPGQSTQITVNAPRNAGQVQATLGVQDALFDDNRAMLPLGSDRLGQLDILLVSDAPSNILRALQVLPGSSVDVQSPSVPGIQDVARSYALVVFEGAAPPPAEMPDIPMLFVQPPAIAAVFGVSGAVVNPVITSINATDPLLEGVDLSGVTFGTVAHYDLPVGNSSLVTGISEATSIPLIWRGDIETMRYVALAFSITESNIDDRVAFPILIARIVEDLTSAPISLSITLGDPLSIPPVEGVSDLEVVLPDQSILSIPVDSRIADESTLSVPAVIDVTGLSGIYAIRSLRSDGTLVSEGLIAVNAGDVQESNLFTNPDLVDGVVSAMSSSSSAPGESSGESELWLALALFAFAVLLLEWMVSAGSLRLPFRLPGRANG